MRIPPALPSVFAKADFCAGSLPPCPLRGTFVAAVADDVVDDDVVVAGNCLSVGPSVPWCCTSAVVASPRAGSWSCLHTSDVAGAAALAVCVCE